MVKLTPDELQRRRVITIAGARIARAAKAAIKAGWQAPDGQVAPKDKRTLAYRLWKQRQPTVT